MKMQIKPFKAFRFDKAVVGDVGNCIAPPYDVISDDQQEQLYKKSEYNIVRIIKGKQNTSDNGDKTNIQEQPAILTTGYNKGR